MNSAPGGESRACGHPCQPEVIEDAAGARQERRAGGGQPMGFAGIVDLEQRGQRSAGPVGGLSRRGVWLRPIAPGVRFLGVRGPR